MYFYMHVLLHEWAYVSVHLCGMRVCMLDNAYMSMNVQMQYRSGCGSSVSHRYFALSKCGGFALPNATVAVEFELRAQQFDSSELSVELRYMPLATGIAIACLSGPRAVSLSLSSLASRVVWPLPFARRR